MSRINTNLRAVERVLVREGVKDVLVDEILDAMNKTELELCRDHGALESTFTIATVANQEAYTIPIGAGDDPVVDTLVAFQRPSGWSVDPDFTQDPKEYARHKAEVTTGTQPLLCLIYGGQMLFNPAPASVVTLTFRAYLRPKTKMSEYKQNPDEPDPTIDEDWDRAIQLGALDKLLPGSRFAGLYETETRRVAGAMLVSQQLTPMRIRYSATRLGF